MSRLPRWSVSEAHRFYSEPGRVGPRCYRAEYASGGLRGGSDVVLKFALWSGVAPRWHTGLAPGGFIDPRALLFYSLLFSGVQ